MTKVISVLLAQSLLLSADTLYVDNDLSHPADYRTLASAYAAAVDGDVILLAPSEVPYQGLQVLKSITIKGNGFGGDAPPNEIGVPVIAKINSQVSLGGSDSEGQVLSAKGAVLESLYLNSAVKIYSQNCLIKRCYITGSTTAYGPALTMEGCSMKGNSTSLITSSTVINDGSGNSLHGTSLNVRNSIFFGRASIGVSTTGSFNYCVFRETSTAGVPSPLGHQFNNAIVRNSIFGRHSTLAQNQPGSTLNCLFLDDSTIFGNSVDSLSSTYGETFTGEGEWGAYYQLKEGSPALTANPEGEQIGIFGGPTPFKVGGYPPVPRILRADMISANPTTGITFKVEAEARD